MAKVIYRTKVKYDGTKSTTYSLTRPKKKDREELISGLYAVLTEGGLYDEPMYEDYVKDVELHIRKFNMREFR